VQYNIPSIMNKF